MEQFGKVRSEIGMGLRPAKLSIIVADILRQRDLLLCRAVPHQALHSLLLPAHFRGRHHPQRRLGLHLDHYRPHPGVLLAECATVPPGECILERLERRVQRPVHGKLCPRMVSRGHQYCARRVDHCPAAVATPNDTNGLEEEDCRRIHVFPWLFVRLLRLELPSLESRLDPILISA